MQLSTKFPRCKQAEGNAAESAHRVLVTGPTNSSMLSRQQTKPRVHPGSLPLNSRMEDEM